MHRSRCSRFFLAVSMLVGGTIASGLCPLVDSVSRHRVAHAQEAAPRTPVSPAMQLLQATVKVFNPRSTAAGFLVQLPAGVSTKPRECALVTAHHVLEQSTGEKVVLVLRKREEDGSYVRHDFPITVREKETALWTRHPKHDLAVLKVELPEGVAVEPIPYESLIDESQLKLLNPPVGARLLAMGYPTRFESNGAGFPVTRQGILASYPLLPIEKHAVFLMDTTAFAGDSGGPVMVVPREPVSDAGETSPSPLRVMGLVTGQVRNDERMQSLVEERVIHHSLGIAVVVQARFIRDVLESLRSPPSG